MDSILIKELDDESIASIYSYALIIGEESVCYLVHIASQLLSYMPTD